MEMESKPEAECLLQPFADIAESKLNAWPRGTWIGNYDVSLKVADGSSANICSVDIVFARKD